MENETQEQDTVQVIQKSALYSVTPLSKYLAMVLFIVLPFVGGYIGYAFAPEKVMTVEREVVVGVDEYLEGLNSPVEETGPYANPEVVIFPKDSSDIVEVVFEGDKIFAKAQQVSPGKWIHATTTGIDNVEYLGYGLYLDNGELRALEHPWLLDNEQIAKLDPSKSITFSEQTFEDGDQDRTLVFIDNEDKVFLYTYPGYSVRPALFEAPVSEIRTLTNLGRGYYSDGDNVFYITPITFSAYFLMLEGVTPEGFLVDTDLNIGVSGEYVYHHGKLLEGLSFLQLDSSRYGVLKDDDTVYVLRGSCDLLEYESASFEELETYQAPC